MTTPESPEEPQGRPREDSPSSPHENFSSPEDHAPLASTNPYSADRPSNSRNKWLLLGGGIAAAAVAVVVVVVVVLLMSGGGGGGSTELLQLVPEEVEALVILNVAAVGANRADFPGDFNDFGDEVLDEIESEFDTEEIQFDEIRDYAILVHPAYGGEALLITGEFAFEDIRDDWNEQDFDDDSYRGLEIWSGYNYYALLEDQGAIFVSDNEDFVKDVVKLVDDDSGSLADSTDSNIKLLVDKLRGAPVVIALANDICDDLVTGCIAYGAAYAGADLDRQGVTTELAVLFSSDRRAERAFDDYDETAELMEDVLHEFAEEADDISGLPNADGVDVDDLKLDGLFITATGIIEVEE